MSLSARKTSLYVSLAAKSPVSAKIFLPRYSRKWKNFAEILDFGKVFPKDDHRTAPNFGALATLASIDIRRRENTEL
jgi:hypothetical protein